MASDAAVVDLMRRVHRAVHASWNGRHRTGAAYRSVTLYLPGLSTSLIIKDVDVHDMLVPDVEVDEPDRIAAFTDALGLLSEPEVLETTRVLLNSLLGLRTVRFLLLGKTPAARIARLLWALGKGLPKEMVGDDTLVILAPSGEFGVRGGKLVGGDYAGFPQALDLTSIREVSRVKVSRAVDVVGIRTILVGRSDPAAYWIFCLLYAVAEWDSRIILASIMKAKPTLSTRNVQELERITQEHMDPYRKLQQILVPSCLTYRDFIKVFGYPKYRKLLPHGVPDPGPRPSTRLRLSAALKTLPFI